MLLEQEKHSVANSWNLDEADQGELSINKQVVNKLKDKSLSSFRNQSIGFVFQFHNLLAEFTALENICLPAFISGTNRKEAEKRAINY